MTKRQKFIKAMRRYYTIRAERLKREVEAAEDLTHEQVQGLWSARAHLEIYTLAA